MGEEPLWKERPDIRVGLLQSPSTNLLIAYCEPVVLQLLLLSSGEWDWQALMLKKLKGFFFFS